MAYENMRYEYILQRMMDRVTLDYPNLDTREGSMIFNALASAAAEVAIAYIALDNTRYESSVSTASREYILQGCRDMGMDVSVFEASAGIHKANFDVEVAIGSRWNCDLYNYEVTEYIGRDGDYYSYRVVCETLGTAPNNQTGYLTSINDIPSGLKYSYLVECLIEGENETPDDAIRASYYSHVNKVATDGNVNQYERWCEEYSGIGNYKVIPQWDGDNTVKVSILSASNGVASEELVAEFQEYLDPGVTGMGNGQAPIGAFVTVDTAIENGITVSANITMKQGYTDTTAIDEAIREYFASISYKTTKVSYMSVGAVILGVDGVVSVSNLKLDDGAMGDDVNMDEFDIPVLSDTEWTVDYVS